MRITAFPSVAMMVSASMAAPISSQFTNIYNVSPALIEFYARVSNYIGDTALGNSATCSTSGITLPAAALAANGLGPVPADQVLKYVAIGHGTQVCKRFHNLALYMTITKANINLTTLELYMRRLHCKQQTGSSGSACQSF